MKSLTPFALVLALGAAAPAWAEPSPDLARATALLEADKTEEAVAVLEAAIAAKGDDQAGALADFQSATKADPQQVDSYVAVGIQLAAMDRREEALVAYGQALQLDPLNYEALTRRAALLYDLELWAEALAAYQAAAKAHPKDAGIQVALGDAFIDALGDDNRALAAYTQATRLDPQYLFGWWARAAALNRLGKHKAALEAYERAVLLDPVNALVLVGRAGVRVQLDDEGALADLDAALKIEPKLVIALKERGDFHALMENWDKALTDYDAAIVEDPKAVGAILGRGDVYLQQGRLDRALRDANRALEVDPEGSNAQWLKGRIYTAMGDHLQALEAYDQVIRLAADFAPAWLARSISREQLGDSNGSAADRRQALKLDPKVAG